MLKRLLPSLSFIMLILLTACDNTNTPTANNTPIPTPATTRQQSNTTSATMAIGSFQEYTLPQANSDMMRPAIDHQGHIWFGEMGHNYLASFDPQTQNFQQMTPPRGANGIMGIAVAPDDTIWFAEQYANYIGHYVPTSHHYHIYNLPTLIAPDPSNKNNTLTLPSAPNDIALDAHGNVWFTEMNADALGRLDTKTGLIKQYPISAQKSIQALNPYGITIDQQGIIWFTESSTNRICRLDPATGDVRLFSMQGSTSPLMEIANDQHGSIWATSFNSGLLLKLNSATGIFTPYNAPYTGNVAGGSYGLTVTPDGEVWATITAENVIARLDVTANHFLYYRIPTPASLPLGIVMGANHTLWFTEAGSNKIGMLKP